MKDHIGKNDGDQDAPVAMPDRARKPRSRLGMFFTVSCLPVTNTTTQAITSTTMVRKAVATLESVC